MGRSEGTVPLFFDWPFFLSLAFRILVSSFYMSRIWLKSSILNISMRHSLHFYCFLFFFDLKNSAVICCYACSSELNASYPSCCSLSPSESIASATIKSSSYWSSSSPIAAYWFSSCPPFPGSISDSLFCWAKKTLARRRRDLSAAKQSESFLTTSISPVVAFSFSNS